MKYTQKIEYYCSQHGNIKEEGISFSYEGNDFSFCLPCLFELVKERFPDRTLTVSKLLFDYEVDPNE